MPQAQSAQRMERGEGREANWLSHPLQRERERERERETDTPGRRDVDGWKEMKATHSADLISTRGLALNSEPGRFLCVSCVVGAQHRLRTPLGF